MTTKTTILPELLFSLAITSQADYSYLISEIISGADYFPTVWSDSEAVEDLVYLYFEDQIQAQKALLDISKRLDACSDIIPTYKIQIVKVLKQEWTEYWKKFFHVTRIGKNIVIKPKWEDYKALAHDCVIEIDPEMSFGSGRHATTNACLIFLEKLITENPTSSKSFLDIGCGSGILSIAAAKLGLEQIDGFDLFTDAIEVAHKNCALNQVQPNLLAADLFSYQSQQTYDLVVANVLCEVLMPNAERIAQAVKNGGRLILAGILVEQYAECISHFEKYGLRQLETIDIDGWRSGVFEKCN